MADAINIVFDGPPSHESGRFVEVELDSGESVGVGEWIEREDGLCSLRITPEDIECASPSLLSPSSPSQWQSRGLSRENGSP